MGGGKTLKDSKGFRGFGAGGLTPGEKGRMIATMNETKQARREETARRLSEAKGRPATSREIEKALKAERDADEALDAWTRNRML